MSQAQYRDWHRLERARDPMLRLLNVPHAHAPTRRSDLPAGASWRETTPETARDFSALCLFFGQSLRETDATPIGLIHSSWGGARAQAWITADRLSKIGAYAGELSALEAFAADPVGGVGAFGEQWRAWWRRVQPQAPEPWLQPESLDLRTDSQIFRDWRSFDDPAMARFTGLVWYVARARLDAEAAQSGSARISLGGVDEIDAVWINGRFIGSSFGWGDLRDYAVPPDVLRPGANDIVVAAYSSWEAGGLVGPAEKAAIIVGDGAAIRLRDWRYSAAPQSIGAPPGPPWSSVAGVTTIGNAMMAPLAGQRVKAAIWYQGESNTGSADDYEDLLGALVDDWREYFGPDLKVVIVQLPAFGAPVFAPGGSGWASLRDKQRRFAASDPSVGLAVTVDLGDAADLHPANKRPVARRVVESMRRLFAGADVAWRADGGSPLGARREGEDVVIAFRDDLATLGGADPWGFELCAGQACAPAPARIDARAIRLEAGGASADRVRYLWADAPAPGVYAAGAPITPFEIEIGK